MVKRDSLSDAGRNSRSELSVVIPTKDRIDDLKSCIKSIIIQNYPVKELIIVDGSDNDSTERYIRSLIESNPELNCIYINQKGAGTARARNIGARSTSGNIIVFIDDDVILDENYMREIASVFEDDALGEIGGVGGKAREKRERERRMFDALYSIFGLIFLRDSRKKGCVTVAGHPARFPDRSSYVEWLDGKNMAYRKGLIGNFDERLETLGPYAYYEDFDFSYSVNKKYKLFLNTRAGLIHNASQIARVDPFKVSSIKIQNQYYLVKKHSFSKAAFFYSSLGLLIAQAVIFMISPHRKNYLEFAGLIDGLIKIIKAKSI